MTKPAKIETHFRRTRRMAREPKVDPSIGQMTTETSDPLGPAEPAVGTDKPQTKIDLVVGLLAREEGATLDQLVVATGWLPHTTRAALTGIKRKGYALSSEKVDQVRTYRVALTEGTA